MVRLLSYSTQRLGDIRSRFGPFRHPLACWFNPCDKPTRWNINSAIVSSIEHTDKQEGSGSLKLVNDNVAAEDLLFAPTILRNCARFFGFWLKIIDPPSDFDMHVRKRNTATGHFETFHFYVSGGVLYYRPHGYGGYWADGLDEVMNADSWYWFEMMNAPPRHYYYVNGSLRWNLAFGALDVENFDILEGLQTSGKTLGTILLDYWRLAAVEQYPPT